ncbi:MAG TPA: hypothetical protein VFQ53_30335 [Kofleriaceae bacterium]|nr:hypothetical protein [Kofleriaceae bacterium]
MRTPIVIPALIASALASGGCKDTPKGDTKAVESTRVQQEHREPTDRVEPNAPALGGQQPVATDAGAGSAGSAASQGTTGAIPPPSGSGSGSGSSAGAGSGSAR